MDFVCVLLEDLFTQDAHLLHREHLGDRRVVLAKPLVQALFRTLDDRDNVPERVVEV